MIFERGRQGVVLPQQGVEILGGPVIPQRPVPGVQGEIKVLNGVLVPAVAGIVQKPQEPQPVIPTDDELLRYGQKVAERNITGLSATDIALAQHNTGLFIKQKLGRNQSGASAVETELLDWVAERSSMYGLKNKRRLRKEIKSVPNADIAERRTEKKIYMDRYTGERVTVTTSSPGPFEDLAIRALDMVTDRHPTMRKSMVPSLVLQHLTECLTDWRAQYASKARDETIINPISMPDLARRALNSLEFFSSNRAARKRVYRLIEQVAIPEADVEPYLKKMDELGDLDCPLAYQLMFDLHELKPDADWFKEQGRRRAELMKILEGSPQDVFNQYDMLVKMRAGLLLYTDIADIPSGKVGLEVEYAKGYRPSFKPTNDWVLDRNDSDMGNMEVKRRSGKENLEHNEQYARSLIGLRWYLEDQGMNVSDINIHLDKKRHPQIPRLGELFGGAYHTVEASYTRATWEVRPFIPIMMGNGFNPALVEGIIGMYIHASREGQIQDRAPLKLLPEASPDLQQLIWGQICRYIQDPQGRLAALQVMKNPYIFSAVNPLGVMGNYAPEDREKVLRIIGRDALKGNPRYPSYHQTVLNLARQLHQGARVDLPDYEKSRVIIHYLRTAQEGGVIADPDILMSIMANGFMSNKIVRDASECLVEHTQCTYEEVQAKLGNKLSYQDLLRLRLSLNRSKSAAEHAELVKTIIGEFIEGIGSIATSVIFNEPHKFGTSRELADVAFSLLRNRNVRPVRDIMTLVNYVAHRNYLTREEAQFVLEMITDKSHTGSEYDRALAFRSLADKNRSLDMEKVAVSILSEPKQPSWLRTEASNYLRRRGHSGGSISGLREF